jgi:hypothetical protein
MYDPQLAEDLDFEMGAFGAKLKKGLKKINKGIGKVTNAILVKPSAAIGKAIGGKKGEAIGRKLGKIAAFGTKVATGAALAPALIPAVSAAAPAIAGAVAAKKIKANKAKAAKAKTAKVNANGNMSVEAHADTHAKLAKTGKLFKKLKPAFSAAISGSADTDNALAAQVGATLVAKLGKPLDDANKQLQLADLQRTATYEHNKLMADSEFRKKVLTGIANLAAAGNAECSRTVRVLMSK